MQLHTLNDDSPTVAILTPLWSEGDEAGWALRQVASVLACAAEVHVITTQGERPRSYPDGVFAVHELASGDYESELRRDIVLDAIGAFPSEEAERDRAYDTFRTPWATAADRLARLAPVVVLVADHRQLGAFEVADSVCIDAATLVVPMLTAPRRAIGETFARGIAAADSVICFTDEERRLCAEVADPDRVHLVGVPLGTNPNVFSEPEPRLADRGEYILVMTGAPLSALRDPWLDLLTMRFASRGVVVNASNALVIYQPGGAPPIGSAEVTRHNDMLRLMAWARVSVDLHPGPLFGRRSLESLLHGTPIVVPADSSAREHAELGSAGLWFDDVSSLLWCTEALLDPALRSTFGAQGERFAQDHYGSRGAFVAGVTKALDGAANGEGSVRSLAREALRFAGGVARPGVVASERGPR